jgi:hypothetical protein
MCHLNSFKFCFAFIFFVPSKFDFVLQCLQTLTQTVPTKIVEMSSRTDQQAESSLLLAGAVRFLLLGILQTPLQEKKTLEVTDTRERMTANFIINNNNNANHTNNPCPAVNNLTSKVLSRLGLSKATQIQRRGMLLPYLLVVKAQ